MTLTDSELAEIKRTVALRSASRRGLATDPSWAMPLPGEVSVQLTYRCNLRCTHCYQWSEQGFFRDFSSVKQRGELDVEILDGLLRATDSVRSRIYLWGGEPLMHSRFGDVAQLLAAHSRRVTMCTNGLLLERNLEHLLKIGPGLALLVSLDGLEAHHDALRGAGSYRRTLRNISTMLELKRSGEYAGEVSLGCMVSHETVGEMYDVMEWAEELGVNTVYFQFPWYISPTVAARMDEVYAQCFSWLNPPAEDQRPSWHSYTYALPEESLEQLRASMARLAGRTWRNRIRYQPQLELDEVADFVRGTARPAQRRERCLAVSHRMEVHADGKVSSCKFFPEFVVGDLHEGTVEEVWHGENFSRVRDVLAANGLLPVCSKCILLYTNGV